uniref:LIX1-like protein n=1 Tax=Styela clava TaxID=7725 RepID=UPI0019399436|nr:LIX1-like protein [Styela clava]
MSLDNRRPQTPASVVLAETVNAVLKSFAKHSANGTVVASEALQEFWDMKWSKNMSKSTSAQISYEMETEIINGTNRFVCYVTLPGGSCYGSSTISQNEKSARQKAAKVALMNSVFNEHPSRQINSDLIEKILTSVASGKSESGKKFQSCLDAFKSMLLTSNGKSLLMFQEMMIIFQLLHWNGNLKEMKRRQCSREEVIARYAGSSMDDRLRDGMVRDWKSRELKLPGVVKAELSAAEESIRHCREVGVDLRFHREKRDILRKVVADVTISNTLLCPTKGKTTSSSSAIDEVFEDNDTNITI